MSFKNFNLKYLLTILGIKVNNFDPIQKCMSIEYIIIINSFLLDCFNLITNKVNISTRWIYSLISTSTFNNVNSLWCIFFFMGIVITLDNRRAISCNKDIIFIQFFFIVKINVFKEQNFEYMFAMKCEIVYGINVSPQWNWFWKNLSPNNANYHNWPYLY